MLERKSPEVVNFTDTGAINSDDFYDISEESSFQVAVGLKNYRTGIRNDPRYIQWVVASFEQKNVTDLSLSYVPLHECTPDDLAKFHPIEKRSEGQLNQLVAGKGLFCFDWQAAKLPPMYGHWQTDESFTAIDVQAIPCSQRFTMPNGTVVEPRTDCVQSKEEIVKYLGDTISISVYHNKETFH